MPDRSPFDEAGKKPGLQVWRVEKMTLVQVPRQFHREFYTGDSYVVLFTDDPPSYRIHCWQGNEASQDERGAAAILMSHMDDHFKGAAIQYLEYQGEESTEFLGYFKHGLIYKKGGIASGFNHVEINASDIKLCYQVKGRRNIRAKEVEVSWASFNTGDCFILEINNNIYLWSPCQSNPFERLKAAEIAIDIRDLERMGRSNLHYVNEGEEPDAFLAVLGPKPELPPASCDKTADSVNKRKATLYLISNASGTMKTNVVASSNPFQQEMLDSGDCFILDTGCAVFVWKGKNANCDERRAAKESAKKFIEKNNYPEKTPVSIVPQGGEPPLFKQYFPCWLDKDETTGPRAPHTTGSIAKRPRVPFDPSKLHNNREMAAQHSMVDDGSGTVKIWRVEGGDKELVDPKVHGQFYGGDCYLILYTYKGGYIIYTWQGQKSSQEERGASAILTVALDDEMKGAAMQVRVVQGKEPAHLLSIFKDKPVVVYLGGTCRKHGDSKPASTRLFHIRMKSIGCSYAVEVTPDSSNLNTSDIFVLKSPEGCFLWKGKGAQKEELSAAKYVASLLGGNFAEIDEGMEPGPFWSALGGKKCYQNSPSLMKTIQPVRCFGCSNKTGIVEMEEVSGELMQSDLATDDVMILDTWDQLFVWIGNDSNECEKTGSYKIAKEYIDTDPAGRQHIPICTIKQGEEPPSFTGWFHTWDPKFWKEDRFSRLK